MPDDPLHPLPGFPNLSALLQSLDARHAHPLRQGAEDELRALVDDPSWPVTVFRDSPGVPEPGQAGTYVIVIGGGGKGGSKVCPCCKRPFD